MPRPKMYTPEEARLKRREASLRFKAAHPDRLRANSRAYYHRKKARQNELLDLLLNGRPVDPARAARVAANPPQAAAELALVEAELAKAESKQAE